MPKPCIAGGEVSLVVGSITAGKAAIKRVLARLNPSDEKELSAFRARVGTEDAPLEPEPGASQHD